MDAESKYADEMSKAQALVVAALKPLSGKGESHFDCDTVGPDTLIRSVVRAALEDLQLDGLCGCILCCS